MFGSVRESLAMRARYITTPRVGSSFFSGRAHIYMGACKKIDGCFLLCILQHGYQ